MENSELLKNIAELEARLIAMEAYINALVEINKGLKQPEGYKPLLSAERVKSKKKYMGL